MQIRDVVAGLSCLAIAAGVGLLSDPAFIPGHEAFVGFAGWVLIAGGLASALGAILSAILEKPPEG